MTYMLTLSHIENVTHDTYALRFPKPDGLEFRPGQATLLSVNKDGWSEEKRPFTFTSQPEDDFIEFIIKSYASHQGVTEQISKLVPGDEVKLGKVWGAITDQGPGIFIAGGAGITPFIPILRNRAKLDELQGCTLLFGAKKQWDLILQSEWDAMEDLDTRYILSDEAAPEHDHGHIGLGLLNTFVEGQGEGSHMFYICGPDPMINSIRENLLALNVPKERIVTEDGH